MQFVSKDHQFGNFIYDEIEGGNHPEDLNGSRPLVTSMTQRQSAGDLGNGRHRLRCKRDMRNLAQRRPVEQASNSAVSLRRKPGCRSAGTGHWEPDNIARLTVLVVL